MAKSILQEEKACFVTGCETGLDLHHIYFGNPNRKISDQNGFTVYLRHDIHMMLHARQKPFEMLDRELKERCQKRFEEMGHTREEFMSLIGRNYLYDHV